MKYIDSWLTGLGLEKVIPRLKAQGITTPKLLAALTLKDMYEVVGIEDAEDRKKLYFLIQRLQTVSIFAVMCIVFLSQDHSNENHQTTHHSVKNCQPFHRFCEINQVETRMEKMMRMLLKMTTTETSSQLMQNFQVPSKRQQSPVMIVPFMWVVDEKVC